MHNFKRFLFALTLAVAAFLFPLSEAQATFVQQVSTASTAAVTSMALPAMTLTAGNFVAVWVGAPIIPTFSISSSPALTWNSIDACTTGAGLQWWYAMNVSGGSTTITVSSNSAAFMTAGAAEYSGVATSAALDQHVINCGAAGPTVTSPTTGALAQASELAVLVAYETTSTETWTAGSIGGVAATVRIAQDNATDGESGALEDATLSSTAAVSGTITESVGHTTGVVLATFKLSGGPPPAPKRLLLMGVGALLVYNDSTPVAGSVSVSQQTSPTTTQQLGQFPLGATGSLTGSISIDLSVGDPLAFLVDINNPSGLLLAEQRYVFPQALLLNETAIQVNATFDKITGAFKTGSATLVP